MWLLHHFRDLTKMVVMGRGNVAARGAFVFNYFNYCILNYLVGG